MSRNFFDKAFDESTKLKLELYKNYLNEWLPVFLANSKVFAKQVNIFDFFAGKGIDSKGNYGSPLIAVEALNNEMYASLIEEKQLSVNLFFFDKEKEYIEALKSNVEALSLKNKRFKIHYHNMEFVEAFEISRIKMAGAANLIFMDQFGVKNISRDLFQEVIDIRMTDIIFFISSYQFNRFYWHESFKSILNISKEELKEKSFFQIHRLILEKYREFIPNEKTYYLAPFSIKRGSSINGLIFGSSHLLGFEKFLKVCWNQDKLRGQANFDIDQDNIKISTPSLFEQFNKPKKLRLFEKELEDKILSGKLKNDKDIYTHTITSGFLGSHARPVLKKLKKTGKIRYKGLLALSYSTVIKKKNRESVSIEIV